MQLIETERAEQDIPPMFAGRPGLVNVEVRELVSIDGLKDLKDVSREQKTLPTSPDGTMGGQ
ncbi:MAG TPA: hypothetical protein DCE43_05500 [Planctomycetaceae bacterium]|nr:hypothetical protein [Planctomycetaceae bacterium]